MFDFLFGRGKRIEAKIDLILKRQEKQMADLTKLTADVTAATTADASIVALLNGIAAQLRTASGDQAAVDALATQLEASTAAIAAAVKANTPAAPAGPVVPSMP